MQNDTDVEYGASFLLIFEVAFNQFASTCEVIVAERNLRCHWNERFSWKARSEMTQSRANLIIDIFFASIKPNAFFFLYFMMKICGFVERQTHKKRKDWSRKQLLPFLFLLAWWWSQCDEEKKKVFFHQKGNKYNWSRHETHESNLFLARLLDYYDEFRNDKINNLKFAIKILGFLRAQLQISFKQKKEKKTVIHEYDYFQWLSHFVKSPAIRN